MSIAETDSTPDKWCEPQTGKDAYGNEAATRLRPGSGREGVQCAALEGTIGEQVRCLVYEQRPVLCRGFPIGCPECVAARGVYGLEPVDPV